MKVKEVLELITDDTIVEVIDSIACPYIIGNAEWVRKNIQLFVLTQEVRYIDHRNSALIIRTKESDLV